jgi:C-terminal processing protease CtpA/Prc
MGGLWSMMWHEMTHHDRPYVERLGDGIVYARLPSMNLSVYAGARRSVEPLASDRVLIVDVRGNDGGAMDLTFPLIDGWVDTKALGNDILSSVQLVRSCLFAPLKWGFETSFGGDDLVEVKPALARLLEPIATAPLGCPRVVDPRPSGWTYRDHHFAPRAGKLRVLVVTNAGCGSDCEGLTYMLAHLPETLVVGASTLGIGQFVQPGHSVLPHARLPYRIALGSSDFYGDDRSVDGYGLDVDVILAEVDSLDAPALAELARLVTGTP